MRQRRLHPLLAPSRAGHRGRGLPGVRRGRELRPERRPARDAPRVRRAHLGVVRGDDRRRTRACRPTAWPPTARRASRRRRRTSARTCGAPSSPSRLGIIDHDEAVARLKTTLGSLETMERHEAERPVLQLVRPHERRGAHRLAADRRPGGPDPLVRRQRLAGDRHPRRRERRPRAVRRAPAPSSTAWTSASTTGPSVNRIAFHFAPSTGAARRAATTRS